VCVGVGVGSGVGSGEWLVRRTKISH
jgi:hypothetical protein